MKKEKKLEKLYLEILEVEHELEAVKDLYERKHELLEEIYELRDEGQVFEIDGEEKVVKVVLQKGHYVFNRPFRLSITKNKAA